MSDITATVAKTPKDSVSTEKKSSRQQISKLIGINLSVSRVRKHVDKNNVNADIEAACCELKALHALESKGDVVDHSTLSVETVAIVNKAYSQIYDVRKSKYEALKARLGGDPTNTKPLGVFHEKTETLAEKIDYVSKLRCRFSNDASVVLSSALDYVVQDIVRTAMVRARSSGKAIIQVHHVVDNDFSSVGVYPLVHCLDAVQKALNVKEHVDGEEDKDNDKGVDTDEVFDDKHDSTFEFYINLICKSVKAKLVAEDETYAPIRISKHIRKFCSDVVIQLIERISPLIKLYAATAKVKTVNDDVIKFIFEFLLLDAGGCSNEFTSFMVERLRIYREVKETGK
jgi:histone H3/H4